MNKISFIQTSNLQHFHVDIKNFPSDLLLLRKFESTEDGIMTDTIFTLDVLTDFPLTLESLIGKEATLHFRWFNQDLYYRGFITMAETLDRHQNYYSYRMKLSSLLHPLTLSQHNRIFNQADPIEIVREMIRDLNISSIIWTAKLSRKIKISNRLVQYHETDWNFMRRILSEQGVGFVWQHGAQQSSLILFNEFFVLPQLPQNNRLPYITLSNQVRDEESIWHWEQHSTQTDEYATAESDCMGLAPGLGFELEFHPEYEYNRGYRIFSVKHRGQQSTEFDNYSTEFLAYHNEITVIADDKPYQALKLLAPKPNTLFTGKILAYSSTIPALNEDGAYQVRLDFDNGEAKKFQEPFPMRKLEPYISQSAGWHFPLRAGTEILATFIDDLNSEPIVLGALPNINSPSPVNQDNAQQHLIKTQLGHQLCLDDHPQKTKITLATAQALNRLVIHVNDGSIPDHIELSSQQGMLQLNADKNLAFITAGCQKQTVSGKHSMSVEGSQRLSSIEGSLLYESGADIFQSASQDFSIQSDISSITLQAKTSIDLNATRDLQLVAEQGQAKLHSEQGSIKLKGNNVHIGSLNAPISFQQANSSLSMLGDKTLLKARNISLKANKISISSSNVMHNNLPQFK